MLFGSHAVLQKLLINKFKIKVMVNANAFIASGVSLLALAAGVALLAKATKDNLVPIYKIAAWIIIIGSIINAGLNSMNCMFRFYHNHMMGHEMKMGPEMEMGKMFMHHKMWHHQHEWGKDGDGACCRDGRMDGDEGSCYRHGMKNGDGMCRSDGQDYWKKCYDRLRDSCSRSRTK
jgi:hypothetical protein